VIGNGTLYRSLVVVLVATSLAACVPVTVNVTFPQQKLDDAASQIVDMSRRPADAPASGPTPAPAPTPKPGSRLERWLAPLGPREAAAEERPVQMAQAPKTDSDELRRLTESQNRRLGAVQQALARGCAGESNQGRLEPRPGQGCSGDVAGVIGAENADRQAIVETFMRQNKIGPSDVGRVRASFAKAYRDRVGGGQWVQTDRGEWVKK
jgi:uncharacterized protein YdbL (DUF1318 family)